MITGNDERKKSIWRKAASLIFVVGKFCKV
jgi:hypothetical protein